MRINTKYWEKENNWQELVNININILTLMWVILGIIQLNLKNMKIMGTITIIIGIIYITPQKLSYIKWKKKQLHNKYKGENK